ncbi:LpxI family protein [Desulfocurvus sp. DL9XJH121]
MSITTLGIVAGGRQFPFRVARAARGAGMRVVVVGFSGHTDPAMEAEADAFAMLHLGQVGKTIRFLKDNGAERVVFCGAISKPKAMDLRPDLTAAKLLMRLPGKGDDALLHALADEFEGQGLPVGNPLDLVPSLATPEGPLTSKPPRERELADLRLAWPKAKAIGEMDIGQSLLMREGIVLAVEGPEGTDAAIRRAGELGGKGMVLCKVYKPGQDLRLDLPAVGVNTVRSMMEAGGACIGIEAGRSVFFDQEEAVALAEKNGIRIVGLSASYLGL